MVKPACPLSLFLKKILELELQLPECEIQSLPCFHGLLSRQQCELLLQQEGQYLVRASSSQVNQFVLSCVHQGQQLHFIIHENDDQERKGKQYSVEGPSFNSVQALLEHYQSLSLPITTTSNAILKRAVARTSPLYHTQLIDYHSKHAHYSLDQLLQGIDKQKLAPLCQETSFELKQTNFASLLSSEYLKNIYSCTSAIELESEQTTERFEETEVLRIINETEPETLAKHLFRQNLRFFGYEIEQQQVTPKHYVKSSIELLLLPGGKQLRRDVIIRNECLKYFVVSTLVAIKRECDNDKQLNILRKWIQIAEILKNSLGDYFGFGCVMSGLNHDKVSSLTWLWAQLQVRRTAEHTLFETHLKPLFVALVRADHGSVLSNTTLPFVIQLCHLVECNAMINSKMSPPRQTDQIEGFIQIEHENHQRFGLSNFDLDDILRHTSLSNDILDSLENFERKLEILFKDHLSHENNCISKIFQTRYHIQFLFGKNINVAKINHEDFQSLEHKLNINNK